MNGMIEPNYRIEALNDLLDEACLSERYHLLVPFKGMLIEESQRVGIRTKNELANLSDSQLAAFGLQDEGIIRLLRRFLSMYDPKPQKFKEIDQLNLDEGRRKAFRELYCLPGVKNTRASLYVCAGYASLQSIADGSPEEILKKTTEAIAAHQLSCIAPLPKEVRTHIAVAKAFTQR